MSQLRDQGPQSGRCRALHQRGGIVELVEGDKVGEAIRAEEGGGAAAVEGHVDHHQAIGRFRDHAEGPGGAAGCVLSRAALTQVRQGFRIAVAMFAAPMPPTRAMCWAA